MKKKTPQIPEFKTESAEADWWASREGRAFVKAKSAKIKTRSPGTPAGGSPLLATLARKSSVQIAIRLSEADLTRARKIAQRKGIGYQTYLKMLVREGLIREGGYLTTDAHTSRI